MPTSTPTVLAAPSTPCARLFDASGVELAVNDDFDGSDSFIEFVAPSSGSFFIGVSSFDNIDYDPVNGGGDTGNSSGNYDLFLDVPIVVTNNNKLRWGVATAGNCSSQ